MVAEPSVTIPHLDTVQSQAALTSSTLPALQAVSLGVVDVIQHLFSVPRACWKKDGAGNPRRSMSV